jgi:hypothetical protein
MIHSSRHSARRRQQRRRLVRAMSLGIVLGVTDRQSLDKPLRLATREPGFYAITNSHIEPAEARNVAALRQRLVLRLHNATVPEALKAIDDQTSLRFVFKQSILPPDATISLDAGDISVAAALTQILMDADVDVEIAPYGLASISSRRPRQSAPDSPTGTIVGRVTDTKTHDGVPCATVWVEGAIRTATTNDSGSFRLSHVRPGTYTLSARRVGYTMSRRSATVGNWSKANRRCRVGAIRECARSGREDGQPRADRGERAPDADHGGQRQ